MLSIGIMFGEASDPCEGDTCVCCTPKYSFWRNQQMTVYMTEVVCMGNKCMVRMV